MAVIDDDLFPSNTFRSRETSSLETEKQLPAPTARKSVVSGKAEIKQKSKLAQTMALFISEDNKKTITKQIDRELRKTASTIISSTMDTIRNIIADGVDILLFPDGDVPSSKKKADKSSFRKYWEEDSKASTSGKRPVTAFLEFGDVRLDTREDAAKVKADMKDCFNLYRTVTVADLYQSAGILDYPFTANKYGWRNIDDIKIVEARDGFYISLPKPIPLDRE